MAVVALRPARFMNGKRPPVRAPWLAMAAAAFVAGAGAVMLADSGASQRVVISSDSSSSASPFVHNHTTAINGQAVTGVKAKDIAAENAPDKPLDASTRATLQMQLVEARTVAMRYPTVQDAVNAGYILAGGFAPGSGAHYVSVSRSGFNSTSGLDIEHPGSLIYAGVRPDSKIIGLMYLGGGATAPAGFAGPNDHWHRHSNVCIAFSGGEIKVPFPADSDVTRAQCTEAGGNLMPITTWMVHAWVVPSWESPLGVFSHDNPNLRCGDGTYDTNKAGFCEGV